MNLEEEIEFIWGLAVPKGKEWQRKDCPIVRSNMGDLRKAWEKARKLTDIKTVELAVQAQAIARRADRQAGGFVPQPKMVGSWLREERWRDEIIPPEQKREAISAVCKCGRPTLGPKIDSCSECLQRTDEKEIHEKLEKTMERLGLLKYAHDKPLYYQKCREYVTKKTGNLIPDKTVNDCKGCKEKLSIVAGMHVNDKGVKVMECKAWKRLQGVL